MTEHASHPVGQPREDDEPALPADWERHNIEELDLYARGLGVDVDALIRRTGELTAPGLRVEIRRKLAAAALPVEGEAQRPISPIDDPRLRDLPTPVTRVFNEDPAVRHERRPAERPVEGEARDAHMSVTLLCCGECNGVSSREAWDKAWWAERSRRMADKAAIAEHEWSTEPTSDYGLEGRDVCPRCGYVHSDNEESYVDEVEVLAAVAVPVEREHEATHATVWTCMTCGHIGEGQSCRDCGGEAMPGRWVREHEVTDAEVERMREWLIEFVERIEAECGEPEGDAEADARAALAAAHGISTDQGSDDDRG